MIIDLNNYIHDRATSVMLHQYHKGGKLCDIIEEMYPEISLSIKNRILDYAEDYIVIERN